MKPRTTGLKGKNKYFTFDNFEISLSHDEHYDYEVRNLKKGKQRGVKKHKIGKHNSKRGQKGKKHGEVNSNEQKEVNNSLVLIIFIAFYSGGHARWSSDRFQVIQRLKNYGILAIYVICAKSGQFRKIGSVADITNFTVSESYMFKCQKSHICLSI